MELDPLGELLANLLGLRLRHRDFQLADDLRQIEPGQSVAHAFRTDLGDERIRTVSFLGFAIFVLAEKLVLLERRVAGVNDQIVFVVDDPLEVARGHVEHEAEA